MRKTKLMAGHEVCNGAIIAGPDQSLPARIKFRSKFTWYTLVYYGVSLLSKEKQLVCLFKYIA